MIVETSAPLAPDWLVGLWRRDSITLSDGTVDRTTRVYWGQTKTLYVDIRVPADRPNLRGCRSFGQLTHDNIRRLAEQHGFAGHIMVADLKCTWTRVVDYQPDTGRPDTGRLRLEGDALYEMGEASSVIGSGYEEVYRRERRGDDLRAALRLAGAEGKEFGGEAAQGAILVILDDRFLFARPRPVGLPRADALQDLIDAAGDDRARIHAYLDCEVAIGSIDASRPWTIHLSTIPFREGDRLFAPASVTIDESANTLQLVSADGASQWHIVESIVSLDALAAVFKT
jgi:hypothetical protein